LILEALISGVLGSYLCSTLGFYILRLRLTTIAFTVAHAALAGAAIALVLGTDMTYLAISFSLIAAVVLGLLHDALPHAMDSICMTLFSFLNAVALLAIYYSNAVVLATASVSAVLWGSILAVTRDKLLLLTLLSIFFTVYVVAYRKHLDTVLFDRRLAEAEGINTRLHTTLLLIITSVTISTVLRIVGGFLVFTLLYVPSALASALGLSTVRQRRLVPIFGIVAVVTGLYVSLLLDLPVGVSIAMVTVVTAALVATAWHTIEKVVAYRRITSRYVNNY